MLSTLARRPAGPETECGWIAAIALAVALALQSPLAAQGLNREEAIDAIVGSEVKTEEVDANAATQRVLAAIDSANDAAKKVRQTFALDELEIVFVPDIEEATTPIAAAISDHEHEIDTLREAIEGSALFYHAVDSRSVLVKDVIALDYREDGVARIFVKGTSEGR